MVRSIPFKWNVKGREGVFINHIDEARKKLSGKYLKATQWDELAEALMETEPFSDVNLDKEEFIKKLKEKDNRIKKISLKRKREENDTDLHESE